MFCAYLRAMTQRIARIGQGTRAATPAVLLLRGSRRREGGTHSCCRLGRFCRLIGREPSGLLLMSTYVSFVKFAHSQGSKTAGFVMLLPAMRADAREASLQSVGGKVPMKLLLISSWVRLVSLPSVDGTPPVSWFDCTCLHPRGRYDWF